MLNMRHIKATRGDVRGDQNAEVFLPEIAHDFIALGLALIPMQRVGGKPILAQFLCHLVRAEFGFHEDDDGAFALMQLVHKLLIFLRLFNADHFLLNVRGNDIGLANGDAFRLAHIFPRQTNNLFGKGCRKHQSLTFRGQIFHNRIQLHAKTHIQHPVGLIQDEKIGVVQIHDPLLQMVIHTPRRADNNTRTGLQLSDLLIIAIAANDKGSFNLALIPQQIMDHIQHLLRQLACRCEDQGGALRCTHHGLNDWDAKSSGLPGPGLRGSEDVMPLQRKRDSLRLNRRGFAIIHFS